MAAVGATTGTTVDEMRIKFDQLAQQKSETENAEKEKADEAQRKFEEHEQVIADDPRDFSNNSLIYWWVEDEQYWKKWGKRISTPNLVWTTLNLLVCLGVIIHWHVMVTTIKRAHMNDFNTYPFGDADADPLKAETRITNKQDDAEEAVPGAEPGSWSIGQLYDTSSDMEMGYDKDKYTGNQYVGLRFASVSIPTNCMIRNAYIEFTVKSTGACCDRNLQISVRMQKHANAPRFQAAGAKNVLHDIWTKSSTEYFKRYVPQIDKKPGDKAYTPTFAKAMQEVVDMPDWKQGNAMVVIFGDSSAKTVRESREYLSADNDAAKAALLVIEYYELDKWNLRVDALPYVAYASAAIFRTINCWMPAIVGGRVNTVLNSVLLCVPMILCSVALSLNACPYPFLWLCVFLSGGFAGGQLATCVNNVSYYFPKRQQGTLLGLMVGLATLGEAITLGLTAPLTSVGICASGKDGECDAKAMGRKYAFNLGAIWTLFLVAVSIGGWVRLNNLPGHGERATLRNIINYLKLSGVAVFWAAVISFAWWMTEEPIDGEAAASILRAFGLLLVIFFFAQGTLRICFRGVIGEKLKQQMSILRTRDAWLMTLLCFATLGTYIAWVWAFRTVAMALFISAQDNPREMMDADTFSFLGPLVGGISIIVGGYFADRVSGAAVTQWSTVGLFIGMFLALVFVQFGNDAKPTERESNLPLWCIASIIIFIFSGAGAGGVFRQIGFLYPPETRGPMLGFATGFATIGALFVVVLVVQAVVHEFTAIIFSLLLIVYIVVIIVNFCFYKRAASTNHC